MEKKQQSLSERTAEKLYEMIIYDKAFSEGDKLPNENELSTMLGVSRATLREAIRVLVAQGILSVRRGKGTYISLGLSEQTGFGINTLERVRVRLSDMYEIRLMFEPQAIMYACERATDAEIRTIRRQAAHVRRAMETGGNWAVEDQAFHRLIAKASHNEFIIRLFPIINTAVQEAMEISQEIIDILEKTTTVDNEMIVDFLQRRDADGARSAMNVHIRHIIAAMHIEK